MTSLVKIGKGHNMHTEAQKVPNSHINSEHKEYMTKHSTYLAMKDRQTELHRILSHPGQNAFHQATEMKAGKAAGEVGMWISSHYGNHHRASSDLTEKPYHHQAHTHRSQRQHRQPQSELWKSALVTSCAPMAEWRNVVHDSDGASLHYKEQTRHSQESKQNWDFIKWDKTVSRELPHFNSYAESRSKSSPETLLWMAHSCNPSGRRQSWEDWESEGTMAYTVTSRHTLNKAWKWALHGGTDISSPKPERRQPKPNCEKTKLLDIRQWWCKSQHWGGRDRQISDFKASLAHREQVPEQPGPPRET